MKFKWVIKQLRDMRKNRKYVLKLKYIQEDSVAVARIEKEIEEISLSIAWLKTYSRIFAPDVVENKVEDDREYFTTG